MSDQSLDLPQGTLDLLILKALSLEPMHGWAISERLHQVSKATVQIPQGSLYPALHRLERRGWIKAVWGTTDNNRKAKYYALTAADRKQLASEADEWARLTAAVALILRMDCHVRRPAVSPAGALPPGRRGAGAGAGAGLSRGPGHGEVRRGRDDCGVRETPGPDR